MPVNTGLSSVDNQDKLKPLQRLGEKEHADVSCLNCGRELSGPFCSGCGQEAREANRPLLPLIKEFADEFFRFDSRLLNTTLALIFRPGFLTLEYLKGRRAKYLSPFRMFITVSVIFFIVLFQTQPINVVTPNIGTLQSSAKSAATGKMQPAKVVSVNIDSAHTDDDDYSGWPGISKGAIDWNGRNIDLSRLPKTEAEYIAMERDPKNHDKHPAMVQRIIEHVYQLRANPQQFVGSLEDWISKSVFLLVPLFAWQLWFFYIRTKRLYVEHLVFTLHTHTFAFLAGMVTLINPHKLAPITLPATALYIFVSMLVVYKQGILKTLAKFSILGISYAILLALVVALAALAAFLF